MVKQMLFMPMHLFPNTAAIYFRLNVGQFEIFRGDSFSPVHQKLHCDEAKTILQPYQETSQFK